MKFLGKLRCRLFGCGPITKHELDSEFDLYVCECCGVGVMDVAAVEQETWSDRTFGAELNVWYDSKRDQVRVRLWP